MRLSIVFAVLVSIFATGLTSGTAEARPHHKSHARSKHKKHKRAGRAGAKHHAKHTRHSHR